MQYCRGVSDIVESYQVHQKSISMNSIKFIKNFIPYILVCVFFLLSTTIVQGASQVEKWGTFEITFNTTNIYSNPYVDVSLSAVFTGPTKKIAIEGFWDGGNTWKIRMAPTEVGMWSYITSSSDSQLDGITGSFEVIESSNKGFIRVNPDYPHTFMYEDGTPFFLMGDTQWLRTFYGMDITKFKQMVDNRATQKFNVFTLSTLAIWDTQSLQNEGGYLYLNGDLSQINPDFFKYSDERIQYMHSKGIKPMIVIGSPDHGLGNHPQSKIENVLRYIIARWAAYDVIWVIVKEYEEWPIDRTKSLGSIVEQYDPYKHLTSTHTTVTTSDNLGTETWMDFNTRQSRDLNGLLSDYNGFSKPVVVAEAYYEGPTYSSHWDFDDPKVLLDGLWGIQLHGGWNAGYQLVPETTDSDMSRYLDLMNNTSAKYHTYLYNFFQYTEFWKMSPSNSLVTSGYALANAGKEYIIYLPTGGSTTVDLSAANGTLFVEWYNPRTGIYQDKTTVQGGASITFTAPDSNDWVLHINSTPTTFFQYLFQHFDLLLNPLKRFIYSG